MKVRICARLEAAGDLFFLSALTFDLGPGPGNSEEAQTHLQENYPNLHFFTVQPDYDPHRLTEDPDVTIVNACSGLSASQLQEVLDQVNDLLTVQLQEEADEQ